MSHVDVGKHLTKLMPRHSKAYKRIQSTPSRAGKKSKRFKNEEIVKTRCWHEKLSS